MNFRALLIISVITALPLMVAGKSPGDKKDHKAAPQKTERTLPVDAAVAITICVNSSNVSVRGWDKRELSVRSMDGAQIQFNRTDKGDAGQPPTKVSVAVLDKDDEPRTTNGCQATGDLELSVPRAATVQIQTTDGNISMSDVATAYAGTQDGQVSLERISRSVEVGSIGGDLNINDSTGRIDLTTVSGDIQVSRVRPSDPSETFEITTVSGDIELTQVAHAQLNVRTVNGDLHLTGPLVHGGHYGVNTMSGDVTFSLPADASFQLDAKVSTGGDIITDFPLMLTSQTVRVAKPTMRATPATPAVDSSKEPGKPPTVEDTPKPAVVDKTPATPNETNVAPPLKKVIKVDSIVVSSHTLRRVHAVCGSGDAAISVASFSGTLHLQKN